MANRTDRRKKASTSNSNASNMWIDDDVWEQTGGVGREGRGGIMSICHLDEFSEIGGGVGGGGKRIKKTTYATKLASRGGCRGRGRGRGGGKSLARDNDTKLVVSYRGKAPRSSSSSKTSSTAPTSSSFSSSSIPSSSPLPFSSSNGGNHDEHGAFPAGKEQQLAKQREDTYNDHVEHTYSDKENDEEFVYDGDDDDDEDMTLTKRGEGVPVVKNDNVEVVVAAAVGAIEDDDSSSFDVDDFDVDEIEFSSSDDESEGAEYEEDDRNAALLGEDEIQKKLDTNKMIAHAHQEACISKRNQQGQSKPVDMSRRLSNRQKQHDPSVSPMISPIAAVKLEFSPKNAGTSSNGKKSKSTAVGKRNSKVRRGGLTMRGFKPQQSPPQQEVAKKKAVQR